MNLNVAISRLAAVYADWPGFLLNPNYCRRDNEITWQSSGNQVWLNHAATIEELALIAETGTYSFQTINGGVFRFWYAYASDTQLAKASLGYVHEPLDHAAASQIGRNAGECCWVRVDYDPVPTSPLLHAPCHLQMSLGWDIRLPIAAVPTPAQFVEAVVAWFYPGTYAQARLNGNTSAAPAMSLLQRINAGTFPNLNGTGPGFAHLSWV